MLPRHERAFHDGIVRGNLDFIKELREYCQRYYDFEAEENDAFIGALDSLHKMISQKRVNIDSKYTYFLNVFHCYVFSRARWYCFELISCESV